MVLFFYTDWFIVFVAVVTGCTDGIGKEYAKEVSSIFYHT